MATSAPVLVESVQTSAPDRGSDRVGSAGAHPASGESGLNMACLDRTLTIQEATPEFFRQFGDSAAGLCGRTFCDLVHPSVQQPLLRQFAGLVEGRRDRFATEVIAVGTEGDAFTVPLTAVAVRGGTPNSPRSW